MPLKWTISHTDKTVEAVASGHVSLQDIERYLDDVMVSDALPYRKLFDASQASSALADEEMMMLGARLSAYAGLGPLGPIAFVAPPAAALQQKIQLFAKVNNFRRLALVNRLVNLWRTRREGSWAGAMRFREATAEPTSAGWGWGC